ncbi:putative oxidoreductase [Hyaloscypha variabilis F]|uniref:Putative oxidoreductase n=1 Tax=Hyaloscypha variabilis (strain UAMH 11265 / GT02V1 / F) TaxID=1149755 RepID=A0A2J6R3T5_HYAVF|nr:putative oxidoreductase [Hyaloscypha variabilis F]
MPSPIRVGIIGLGAKIGSFVPGVWAVQGHLPYLMSSPDYLITAVCNSSVSSAQASIEFHSLGSDVRAHGSPEAIANDPNVDLVVVTVRVGLHYALTKPALLAGKDVFVEWPLAANIAEVEELTQLARDKGVKTIVGLQARASPIVVKIRDLVQSGKLGKILSSTVVGSFSSFPNTVWLEGAEYYLDAQAGAGVFKIFFGHFLDSFTHVLGPFRTLSSILKTEYKTTNILSATGEVVSPNYPKTTPDHVLVQGTLSSGALASLIYRTIPDPDSAIDGVGIRWLITGEEGELELCTPAGHWQTTGDGVVLKARLGKGKEVEVIELEATGGDGGNTSRQYAAFLKGEREKFPDFSDAAETHKLLERIVEVAERS